ncbi:MAG: primosomal protein N' [Clostridiales bacterium]|nr:primosomal protein N' [Clostridiales bacterium]
MDKYAGIIIDQAHPSIDRVFHYSIPEDMKDILTIGHRVSVPFGRYNRHIDGYVVRIDDTVDIPLSKIKSIKEILDNRPALLPKHISLIQWMVDRYHCMTIEAIKCFVPIGLRINMRKQKERYVHLASRANVDEQIERIERRSKYMADILRFLKRKDGTNIDIIQEATSAPASSFKNLERRGWIKIDSIEKYRKPEGSNNASDRPIPKLTGEQQRVVGTIIEDMKKNVYSPFILHGVTGSGKTEVYIRIVEESIKRGQEAIVLVPEISLTPQTVRRFIRRFGNLVAIMHSRLSDGERYDQWRRIKNGDASIVVGARSAIFAPFQNIGVIIIDESHDDSYKSDISPRYHTIEIAKRRCEMDNSALILGTATPPIDEYYRALQGEYTLLELTRRVDGSTPPNVEIVDMRDELIRGNRSMFSKALYEGVHETLGQNKQAILFLNRRGYANFISCRECGWVAECNRCAVSLTFHASDRTLKCHYCGLQYPYPRVCPKCHSQYIKQFGVGTQRLEKELARFFPNARIARMDMDTTSRKGSHERILTMFGDGEYDILLGTQMISKGLDFPNVTLVGVITADSSLNLPEYTSPERTFQLITQVGGRAGRGVEPGRVIVQTYQPEHYAIEYAAKNDYRAFFDHEINIRRQFHYPPFTAIVKLSMSGEDEKRLVTGAKDLETWLNHKIDKDPVLKRGLVHIGAYPAPIARINKRYRWQIIMRIIDKKDYLNAYHALIDMLLKCYNTHNENISIDFRPTSLL